MKSSIFSNSGRLGRADFDFNDMMKRVNKSLLAIDDDPDMLMFYKTFLCGFGKIKTASSLAEARTQLDRVDLIILDFYLESDPELFQEIVPELKKIAPVILCSGIQELDVPVMGASLGVAGYWNKGSDHEALLKLVATALSKANQDSAG